MMVKEEFEKGGIIHSTPSNGYNIVVHSGEFIVPLRLLGKLKKHSVSNNPVHNEILAHFKCSDN